MTDTRVINTYPVIDGALLETSQGWSTHKIHPDDTITVEDWPDMAEAIAELDRHRLEQVTA